MFTISTLRPGLLVSLKTSIRGNVSYVKRDLEADHFVDETTRKAKWETERTVADAQEHEQARKVCAEARWAIARVCASTAFGCLCPESRADELSDSIKSARAHIDAFNATARITKLELYVITGRVA